MKHLIPLIIGLVFGFPTHAAPFCADLLNSKALPKKFAKIAPVYSDDASGWVFTQDQLKDRYSMKSSSLKLVHAIVEEFVKRDVPLAIVIAPPRPIVAGQETLDAAMGTKRYSISDAQSSFDTLIEELAGTGAIVPNLSDAALADPRIREQFYFRRDTHWTTVGSAVSAIALSKAVEMQSRDLFSNDGTLAFEDLVPSGSIDEKGSLSKVVFETCGAGLPPETAAAFDLSRTGNLLDGPADSPAIALLGSSFSNRYKRDHYRFADALARAFDADVENFSVSGGGPIGAIEAYILSGALDRRDHALVVWELPYTESFNSHSFLRQLLGALNRADAPKMPVELIGEQENTLVKLTGDIPIAGIEIVSEDLSKQSFNLEVRFDNGSKSKVYLGRRNSVPSDMRSTFLSSNLQFFGDRTPIEILVTPLKGTRVRQVTVF